MNYAILNVIRVKARNLFVLPAILGKILFNQQANVQGSAQVIKSLSVLMEFVVNYRLNLKILYIVKCDSACLTCINQPNSCLSCQKGLLLSNYQCVTECPKGYEANENFQCVITGLRCPFG